jgi:hypothetical protein
MTQLQIRQWVIEQNDYRYRELLDRRDQLHRVQMTALAMIDKEVKKLSSPTALASSTITSTNSNEPSPEHSVHNDIEEDYSYQPLLTTKRRLVQRTLTHNVDLNVDASAPATILAKRIAFRRSLTVDASVLEASSLNRITCGAFVEKWYAYKIYELVFDDTKRRKKFNRIVKFVRILKNSFLRVLQ